MFPERIYIAFCHHKTEKKNMCLSFNSLAQKEPLEESSYSGARLYENTEDRSISQRFEMLIKSEICQESWS